MGVQLLQGDALHVLRRPQQAHGVGLPGAHLLQQAAGGVNPLIVDNAVDLVDEIGPLAVRVVPPQPALLKGGGAEHVPHELRRLLQQRLPRGQEAVLHAAGGEAKDLVLPHPAQLGAQPGPVEHVQLPAQSRHIRQPGGAPAQDVDQQGVAPRRAGAQGGRHLGAEVAGLELVRRDMGEIHIVHEHLSCHIPVSPFLSVTEYYA